MQIRAMRAACILLGVLFLSPAFWPSVCRAERPATAPSAAPSTRLDFSGEWQTSYGLMTLRQQGQAVEGSYGSGAGASTIKGKLTAAGRLEFTYTETDATGEGWFELSPDGGGFTGKWRPKGVVDWGIWAGKRLNAGIREAGPFSGLWETSFGRMRLRQTGKDVTGIYEFNGRATLTGVADGRKLTFTYVQADGEKGSGAFEISSINSFNGTWKGEKASVTNGGAWNGNRVIAQPGKLWLVVLEAPWERNLEDKEYSFGLMLQTFFARVPRVEVRHRLLHTEADFHRWCAEVPYLAEPVVLYISSHGNEKGLTFGGATVGAAAIADSIRGADNIILLHFGSCLVCNGAVPKEIYKALGPTATFPISGFTRVADWSGSAVVDFTYLDLIFSRGIPPAEAVKQTRKMLTFAGDDQPAGNAIPGVGLVIVEPK